MSYSGCQFETLKSLLNLSTTWTAATDYQQTRNKRDKNIVNKIKATPIEMIIIFYKITTIII
jgi:hypothetical protein